MDAAYIDGLRKARVDNYSGVNTLHIRSNGAKSAMVIKACGWPLSIFPDGHVSFW